MTSILCGSRGFPDRDRSGLLLVACLVLFLFVPTAAPASAGPRGAAEVPPVDADPLEQTWVALDAVLSSRVNARGLVRYAGLLSDPRFVEAWTRLVAVREEDLAVWSREDRLAFWINAYNLATLKLIADHYPIEGRFPLSLFLPDNSILMIKGRWKGNFFPLVGKEISLDQIEHEILRTRFAEPRIHFAIVCASIGCPLLRQEAYRGSRIDSQLEDQARRYFAVGTGLQREGDRLKVTKILDWFGDDFRALPSDVAILAVQGGGERARLFSRVAQWFPAPIRAALRSGRMRFGWISYDWNLNEQDP